MDKGFTCSCNNDPSAETTHKSDKVSKIWPHFSRRCLSALSRCQLLQNNTSVFTAGRPLQQAGCQPLGSAPSPAAQHIHRLSARGDLRSPLPHWVPGIWEEHCISVSSAWAGPQWRAQAAPGTGTQAQPAWGALWRHGKGCLAHGSPQCPQSLVIPSLAPQYG